MNYIKTEILEVSNVEKENDCFKDTLKVRQEGVVKELEYRSEDKVKKGDVIYV